MSILDKIKNMFGGGNKEPQLPSGQYAAPLQPDSAGSYMSGLNVNQHFERAIEAAQERGKPVGVEINGIKGMLADPQSTVEGLRETFAAGQKAKAEGGDRAAEQAVRKSPEHQRLHAARGEQTNQLNQQHQQQMNGLMQGLAQSTQSPESTLTWIRDFSAIADNNQLSFDKGKVEQAFNDYEPEKSKAGQKAGEIVTAMLGQMRDVGVPHSSLSQHADAALKSTTKGRAIEAAGQIGADLQKSINAQQTPPTGQQPDAPKKQAGRSI